MNLRSPLLSAIPAALLALSCRVAAAAPAPARPADVQHVLKQHCLSCHSTEKQKGDLDLEVSDLRKDPQVWESVLEQIALGEMPPKKEPQLSTAAKAVLTGWVRSSLDALALERAGDPGPVILRRLSNSEYTYSIQDLTGVASLEPAREFPADGGAGEGFTNAGAALVMSPALLTKYLDAAKEVAKHLVPLPDGIRFSQSTSAQDWTNETLDRIRALYARHTAVSPGSETVQQGIRLDIGDGSGQLRLAPYLDALQGRGSAGGLSPKYLALLREALSAKDGDPLLELLRVKFRRGELKQEDVAAWQKVLWRFTQVGHIGKENGPKSWQEGISPLADRLDARVKLDSGKDTTLYLAATTAGDGDAGDEVVWENARLVAPGRADIPVSSIGALTAHLEKTRAALIDSCVQCLEAIAAGSEHAPAEHLQAWRDYLGTGGTKLEGLLSKKTDGVPDYAFIKGWNGEKALSVLANPSDVAVRIPGAMRPHSIAMHPAPDRAAVVAWKSPAKGVYTLRGDITHAHPECGNGIAWRVEVRRAAAIEVLAKGFSERSKTVSFGPLDGVALEANQAIVLVIDARDGNHACDLTTVNLNLSAGTRSWDLARDVSPDILKGNPHGAWHFLSQPTGQDSGPDLPAPVVRWRKEPTPANARLVREFLKADFPLTSPLLAGFVARFQSAEKVAPTHARAPSVVAVEIPALLAKGAEFVVRGRLKDGCDGSVQMQVLTEPPGSLAPLVPGVVLSQQKKKQWSDNNLVSEHSAPVVVREGTPAAERWERAFARFRDLFPQALCYTRIVPVDEVVTLTLYYREDEPLRRLILDDATTRELDRLWEELLFVSEAPLKQVAAFEQLWQFATQDAKPSVFEPMRKPIQEAAARFKQLKETARDAQKAALLMLATKAWRRPLTAGETEALKAFEPPLMLVRILTSPAFLYRGEQTPEKTGFVSAHELATRLSYFLWSAPPDERLRALADSGALRNGDTLRAETRRMLADGRVRRLAAEFGCQWLHVRDIGTLAEKSERHFPTFTALREPMFEEAVRFLTDAIQSNAPVTTLLDSDHTFLNAALAAHYGVPFVGEGWQRVSGMKALGRGGILGQAAPLARQSGASRTSPILRGNWVSEVLLGERLPRPPKDVPTLPEEAPEGLTERQLIERHSQDERCAGCHRRIDPIGFALEGFDAIGRSRVTDTKTSLADGTPLEGITGLRAYLLERRRPEFLRQVSRKLLGYALGRSVQLSDKPLLDGLVASGDLRLADLVEQVVLSPQFRSIRGSEAAPHP